MILHIQARPDANPVIYTGTPEEIKKRLEQFKRKAEKEVYAPFCVRYDVQVWTGGSEYYLRSSQWGKWYIYQRGKYCPATVCPGYEYFGHALRRYTEIIKAEKEVKSCEEDH